MALSLIPNGINGEPSVDKHLSFSFFMFQQKLSLILQSQTDKSSVMVSGWRIDIY